MWSLLLNEPLIRKSPTRIDKKYHFRSKLPQTLQKWNRNYHFRSKLGEITWISWFRIWFQNGKFIWFIIHESSLNYKNAYLWTLTPSKSRWNWRFWWFSHQNLKIFMRKRLKIDQFWNKNGWESWNRRFLNEKKKVFLT